MGSGGPCAEPDAGPLVAAVSSNQVGRKDLTQSRFWNLYFLILSRRRLWYMGGTIHVGTNTVMYWTFHATWKSLGLKSGVMHRTCPAITRTYDSVRKDAVTLSPGYNSLNQYSLSNMNERWGDLVSRTCFAGSKRVTSHLERNSIILVSCLARTFWTARNADSMSGSCEAGGVPTVRLAYSSAKKRRHILDTH